VYYSPRWGGCFGLQHFKTFVEAFNLCSLGYVTTSGACLSGTGGYPGLDIIFNWMYSTSPTPVRDNVTARTAQEKFGIPTGRCSIVHACDNYSVR
jgi:hypothetical protein